MFLKLFDKYFSNKCFLACLVPLPLLAPHLIFSFDDDDGEDDDSGDGDEEDDDDDEEEEEYDVWNVILTDNSN